METKLSINPIGIIHSHLTNPQEAPKQGDEGAPEAWLEIYSEALEGIEGISKGDEILILTWLHLSRRDMLKVHPRGNQSNPVTGVFATRSPHRPNPIGLHKVSVLEVDGNRLKIYPMEALNETPVIDIKPVLSSNIDER